MVNTCDHKDLCVKLCLEKKDKWHFLWTWAHCILWSSRPYRMFLVQENKKGDLKCRWQGELGKLPTSEWIVGQVRLGSASGPSASLGSACVGPAQGTSSPKLGNLTKMSSLGLSNTSEWSVLSQDETFDSCSGKKLKHVLKAELKDVCKEAHWQWSVSLVLMCNPLPVNGTENCDYLDNENAGEQQFWLTCKVLL